MSVSPARRRRSNPLPPVPDDGTPLLLTISAAARMLGISRTTLHREIDAGAIAYKRVASDRRIAFAELLAYTRRDEVRAR